MSEDLVKYPFGPPCVNPGAVPSPDVPQDEEEIVDSLDIGSVEQDVYLLNAMLLNLD